MRIPKFMKFGVLGASQDLADAASKPRNTPEVMPAGQMRRRQMPIYIAEEEVMPGRRMKKGGKVKSSASKRADGIAKKGKTRGRVV
jgi:hypothetical protein